MSACEDKKKHFFNFESGIVYESDEKYFSTDIYIKGFLFLIGTGLLVASLIWLALL